jgi:ribonuclease BN (tRNA processing enzyme)
MVHETTLEQAMAEKANSRGHSSSQQTAALAKEAGVGTLIATHFSSRYDAEGCLRCWRNAGRFSQHAAGGRLYGLQDGVKSGHKKTAIPAVFY